MPETPDQPEPQLRLLKVVVQPIFVIDDGDTLLERLTEPVNVSAGDWSQFATVGLFESMSAMQDHLVAETRERAAEAAIAAAQNPQLADAPLVGEPQGDPDQPGPSPEDAGPEPEA